MHLLSDDSDKVTTDVVEGSRSTPPRIRDDKIKTAQFLMSLFDELQTIISITDIGLNGNTSFRKIFQRFLCTRCIVGVIYCDDKVVLGCQSLGDDESETSTTCLLEREEIERIPPVMRAFR